MRDIHKGVIFLILALLASVVTLTMEDRRWEMAFINWDKKQDQDVLDIQAQLFAGIDPTLNAQPTAAGNAINPEIDNPISIDDVNLAPVAISKKGSYCFSGKIARDLNTDPFHDLPYTSIKNNRDTFINIDNNLAFLLKSAYEVQSASLISVLPVNAQQLMQSAIDGGHCIDLDLHLAKIKP